MPERNSSALPRSIPILKSSSSRRRNPPGPPSPPSFPVWPALSRSPFNHSPRKPWPNRPMLCSWLCHIPHHWLRSRPVRKPELVVDLSADYRLKDPAAYERWYQTPHTHPHLLKEAPSMDYLNCIEKPSPKRSWSRRPAATRRQPFYNWRRCSHRIWSNRILSSSMPSQASPAPDEVRPSPIIFPKPMSRLSPIRSVNIATFLKLSRNSGAAAT